MVRKREKTNIITVVPYGNPKRKHVKDCPSVSMAESPLSVQL